MASGETPSPSKGQKLSASSSSSRNDCDETQWMLLPNNLEINSRSKPSKKQRNKEKLRSFPQENLAISMNVAEGFSNDSVAFQNYPRAKCNTASWLKDQLVNDEKSRKKVRSSEEAFPDTDMSLPRSSAMNFPVSLANDVPEHPEEPQRPSSRRSLADNENTKSRKDECRKNEADSAIVFERLSQIQDFLSEATSFCQELEISDEPTSENSCYAVNGISPSSPKASNSRANVPHRDSNASTGFCNEEEHVNKCKNLIEELQQFAGTPMSSKLQETLLYYMQKKTGNKLASFQGSSNLGSHDNSDIETKRSTHDQLLSCSDDPHNMSNSSAWIVENAEEQNRWTVDNAVHNPSFDESEKQLSNWKDPPKDIKQLHVSLERIRKRVQSIQQNPDIKNVTRSLSSDDCEISNVGERVAAVEFERKKLKNKLVELQEKKKMNDVILQKLSYLKDATHTVSFGGPKREDDSQFTPTSRNSQPLQPQNKKRPDSSLVDSERKLYKLQAALRQLEGMMKSISPEEYVQDGVPANEPAEASTSRIDNRNMRSGTSVKRDNVRKEMNSGFPARRHYEAEGRANEDPDIPTAPVASQPAVAGKWQGQPERQDKLRKLQVAQKHVKVIDDIMTSIREAKKSGTPIPIEHLRLLSILEREENNESDNDLSSSDGEDDDLEPLIPENSQENVCTNVKEVYVEGNRTALHQSDGKVSVECDKFVTMKDVMTSLQESEKSGKPIPADHLRALADLYKDQNKDSDSNDGSDVDYDMLRDNTSAENVIAQTKVPSLLLHQSEDHDRREIPPAVSYDENSGNEREHFATYQSLIHQLLQFYHPSVEQRSDDMVRSSGEGGYIPNRNHTCSLPVASDHVQSVPPLQFCHHQDNLLLTRQNIATMESQNQSCSRNLHTKDRSSKKDNINNLSGKMGKLTIQNAVHASFIPVVDCTRDNMDSLSMLSSELNQSHSGDGERKTILDILKRSKKKQKVYDRNQDNQIRSNSSIDSEPLESSNSALAANTTIAATWGGSSTQENFEDENDASSGNVQEEHAVSGNCAALGSNYHDTPKARKICKLGALRGATSGASNEQPTSAPCSRDQAKDYQQQMSSNFIQQLKKQIDQLNTLCQELLSEGPQTSLNFFPHGNQNWLSACPPPQAVPDVHPYNQQLLLCLSQCYHTLYMQQLEIQHLHRCLRHNVDAETLQQANNLNPQSDSAEDIGFRPWCMPPCSNPTMPSNMYSNDHISPRSSAYLPLKHYPSHSNSVSGTRPVRAVIHPASQETRVAQETLNNQVPPRTRANNFWDNFRSYSRQNLLSTSNNVKRNENIGFPVAPQIRQVHPMVSNESINHEQEITNSYASALSSDFNRPLLNPDRSAHNSDAHDLISRSKKPNSSTPLSVRSRYSDFHKKGSLVNINTCGDRNARSGRYHGQNNGPSTVPPVPNLPSVNLIQLYPNQDESKVENFSSICPTSTEASASHSTSETSNFTEGEYQSDFLLGLYREAKALKSDVQRQQALNIIRTIALSEKAGDGDSCQNKVRNDNACSNKSESFVNTASDPGVGSLSVETGAITTDGTGDSEKPSGRLLSESSLPWMSQNLPTAAIPPLSKQVPSKSVSTGAVRKRPKIQSTCFWDSLSSTQACSLNSQDTRSSLEDFNAASLQPIRENSSDFPATIVDGIIVDLQFVLPFGQMREDSSISFWSSINAYIISRIRAYMPVPLPHKSLASLRQTLDHVLTRFSGMKFCDCEAEFLKYISQLLYESITCFMSTGRFTSSLPFLSASDGTSVLESDKPQDLCIKMSADTDDKTRELSINMPTDDVFLPQFQTVLQQNVLSTTGAEDNTNIDNIQPVDIPTEQVVPCEWGPEAEAEPEVEAGTEADLAEADQSPGQQGNISSSLHAGDTWSVDQSANIIRNGPLSSEEPDGTLDDTSEVTTGAHFCPDSCGDPEVILDDVPTKLCSTEEEPQKLEETVHLSSSDDVKENNEPFLENSENEVSSTK